jgi:hypothetical protein
MAPNRRSTPPTPKPRFTETIKLLKDINHVAGIHMLSDSRVRVEYTGAPAGPIEVVYVINHNADLAGGKMVDVQVRFFFAWFSLFSLLLLFRALIVSYLSTLHN